MNSFDRRILCILRDGKPRDFGRLLRNVGFFHDTLRMHLFKKQGFIVKDKTPIKRQ
jgi:hypothetical protein